jgi:hypothetical protein
MCSAKFGMANTRRAIRESALRAASYNLLYILGGFRVMIGMAVAFYNVDAV